MSDYLIINLETKMLVQMIVSGKEIATTNQMEEALLFRNKEEASDVCAKLNQREIGNFQIVSKE